MSASLASFPEALGHPEQPFGMFFIDIEPTAGYAPKTGPSVSVDLERRFDDSNAHKANFR